MNSTPETNERDPETLALYVEESLEGLQQIEQPLLAAEGGQIAPNLLATLFRTVHTIKGTAGYLAFDRTQSLAHRAEDLLSRLRDNKIVATPEHFACLITVSDRLRQMVENVRSTGDEGNVEVASLVAQLEASSQQQDRPTASGVAAAATAAIPPVAPQQPAQAKESAAVIAARIIQSNADDAAAAKVEAPIAKAQQPVLPAPESSRTQSTEATVEIQEPAANKTSAPTPKAEAAEGTVRVNVVVLDRLMNLIGELVLARNQIIQMVKVSPDTGSSTQIALQRLNIVTGELQDQVMKTRMQPVDRVFEKIPRMVRDVARAVDKQVETFIEGNATEIDKALVEAIRDPVMHIVRNAIDHGIETPAERLAKGKPVSGKLFVRAAHKGGAVTIEIEDDGKGMDPAFIRAHAVRKGVLTSQEASRLTDRESLELVFRPGFSTAAAVTDISGRGVGMDVVRTHVEKAGGHAEIDSVFGRGTTIRLKMPLTLAIIPALLVRANNQRFAISQSNLLELVYLTDEQSKAAIEHVRGAAIHKLRGEILPVINLRECLGMPADTKAPSGAGVNIVVLASGSRRYSLVVDAIDNTEEIVIKPLRGQMKRLTCYSGATVLGDGGVALILDVSGIAIKSGIDLASQRREKDPNAALQASATQTMMVFSSGSGVQCAIPLSMVSRLEPIARDKIELIAGREVVQYCGDILPIVRAESILALDPAQTSGSDQLVIVFHFGRNVALAVNEIIDVVDVSADALSPSSEVPYTFGKAIILGKTTILADVFSIMQALAPEFIQHKTIVEKSSRVVVFEPSDAMRSSTRCFLQASGYDAACVTTREALVAEIQADTAKTISVLVANADTLTAEGGALLHQIKKIRPALTVVAWNADHPHPEARRLLAAQASICCDKTDRGTLLKAIQESNQQVFEGRQEKPA